MRNEQDLTIEDHDNASQEVAFLLGTFSSTITELVGKATGTVGMNSGREAARKMPIVFDQLDREAQLAAIQEQLEGGFEIEFKVDGEDLVQQVGRCCVRNACGMAGEELGSDICSMFHAYLRGIVGEATGLKLGSSKITTGGESCTIRDPIF